MEPSGTDRNLIVCIKQVLDLSIGRREKTEQPPQRLPVRLNLLDAYALEAAARLRDADKSIHITALSLGRSGEDEALRQALAIAADDAVLAVVPDPDVLDALAASRLLAQAIRRLESKAGPAELIFCGQQSTDGQSAQVGPQLAQCLNLPFAGRGLEASLCGGALRVRQGNEDGTGLVEMDLPCVAAFDKFPGEPRLPTVRSSMEASRAVIPMLELSEIPAPLLTVRETRPASRGMQGVRICKQTGEDSAKQLFQLLNAAGVL